VALNQCGIKTISIAHIVDCSVSTVYKWTANPDLTNFDDKPRSGRPSVYTQETQLNLRSTANSQKTGKI